MDHNQSDGSLDEDVLVNLIERAQKHGDPEAFDGLYMLFSDRIFRYLFVRLSDAHVAEDVTAEVFLRLIEKISLYRIAPKDNVAIFSAWLYRLSYNKMVDVLRLDQRSRLVEQETARRASLNSSAGEIDDRLLVSELLHKLRNLNDQQHDVIIFRFIEGFSIAETAKIMDKTEAAVKALQQRALESLRRYLNV
jgi:RNA polymerase sigma-70 factor (ECF subfamily)